jgi:hypothetical protein
MKQQGGYWQITEVGVAVSERVETVAEASALHYRQILILKRGALGEEDGYME